MLEVQKYLREGGSLDGLHAEFAIRLTEHPIDPLVILNYDQLDSPKRHPIVQECRGLCLEKDSWNVVARAFTRFFNAGECPDLEKEFVWDGGFMAETKEDGSLALLYRYKDQWRVNTRGSFALGEIAPGVGKTWEEVFYLGLDEVGMEHGLDFVDKVTKDSSTFVFELCSPFNKVVRKYDRVTLYLLTAFHNTLGVEFKPVSLDVLSLALGVKRPFRTRFHSLDEIRGLLEKQEDPTFEGYVLRDRNGMRLKVKSARYVALHHLADNGNIFHPKRLLPFVLRGEQGEVLAYFEEAAEPYFNLVEKLYGAHGRMMAVWEQAKSKESQKDFALYVTRHTPLSSILFRARKEGAEPTDIFRQAEQLLLRHLEN